MQIPPPMKNLCPLLIFLCATLVSCSNKPPTFGEQLISKGESTRALGERWNKGNGLISEGEKQKRINEAEGQAKEIELVAVATAEGIRRIAESLSLSGGETAANLRVAEQYVAEFGNLAKRNNTMIIPSNMADISSMVATFMSVLDNAKQKKDSGKAPEKE